MSSTVLFEGVKYVLTPTVTPTTVQAGQALTFLGTVLGAQVNHPVYLERKSPSSVGFSVVDVGTVTSAGYSISHTFFPHGEGEYRIAIPGDPGHHGCGKRTIQSQR